MKKIIIVGAGFGQVPAIIKAKELGLYVIAVDKNELATGMSLADKSYPIDVIDKEAVLEIAKFHQIDGIITMQSDLPVPTIGFVNDKLGLNGVNFKTANYCSNKIETRQRLNLYNCQQPRFEIVKSIKEALTAINNIGLPCILKVPDSSGSRGVFKINNLEDLTSAFKESFSYTKGNTLLLEEYIDGIEFGAQTFSVDGECISVLLHNDTMSLPPYMIPIGHSFPFKHSDIIDYEKTILDIKKAIKALGIGNGPANVDLIFEKQTKIVKIIEIGARIGATCLPELVYYHTGIDWVEATIMNAIGEPVNLDYSKKQPVAALILESNQNGIYKGYSIIDKFFRKNALEFEITVKEGDIVNKLRKGTDRIGKVLIYGNTAEDAEKKAQKIKDSVKINVK